MPILSFRTVSSWRCFFMLLLFVSAMELNAQDIKGIVVDAQTQQGIPFVNIAYGDGMNGTISDLNGSFLIILKDNKLPIRFSCVGYETKMLETFNQDQDIVVALTPISIELDDIRITPKEDPAWPIVREVVKRSHRYNPDLATDYACVLYHKMNFQVDFPDTLPPDAHDELKSMKAFTDNNDFLLIESVSEKKHLRPNKTNERLISGRVSGFQEPALAHLPAQIQPFAFYDKYIRLLDFEYLNPFSKQGLNNYQFVLKDTLINELGDTLYYIHFDPLKNKNIRGLSGSVHVHQPSYAIKTVATQTPVSNTKFVLKIRQNYQQVNDSIWFPSQMESALQINSITSTAKSSIPYPLVARGKSYVTAITLQPKITANDFNNVTFQDETNKKHAPSIESYRYQPLTSRDSATYQVVDSLGKAYYFDRLIGLQKAAINGYIPMGVVNLDYRKLIDFNDYEGLKLGMGLWTNERLSNVFSAGGYYVYGFQDKKSKYGVGLNLTPFQNPENKFFIQFKDDVLATGTIDFINGFKLRSPESFQRFMYETMDRNEEFSFRFQCRILQYFKTELGFKSATVTPQKAYRFMSTGAVEEGFSYQEGSLRLKWAHKETFSDTPYGRVSNGTHWPSVWLNVGVGQGQSGEGFKYQHYEAQVQQTLKYSVSQSTQVRIKAGQIEGEYPSTLLYSAFGSYKQVGLEIPYSLATMRLNEFGASEFAIFHLRHSIRLWLQKPQRFKPEVILVTNAGYGKAGETVRSFEKGYYESGIFFNNLISQLLVKYGFSVHYRYGPYQLSNPIDNWAFKLGIEFSL